MIASELASGQEKDQFIPGPTSSILEHIHFHQVNKIQTVRSEEQIFNHIDISTHSIEMPFEIAPSVHLINWKSLKREVG